MVTHDDDASLNNLFARYKAACPDVEPRANFMPTLWQKIEARHSFWFNFARLAKGVMTASAALCLLLLFLNFAGTTQNHLLVPTYTDALMADHTAEKIDYTEALRTTPSPDEMPAGLHR
jgi:hypothetical protein